MVGSSNESKSGSIGLLLLRRFVSYPFRRQRRSWKRIARWDSAGGVVSPSRCASESWSLSSACVWLSRYFSGVLSLYQLSEMASSLIRNTIHVLFDSVLAMEHEGMVVMFEALISSGLRGFLGCSSALYEAVLIEFFQNASVRDGQVFSTVQGKSVEISEVVFAGTFELPVEGVTDMNEVPRDLVFDARIKINWGKLLFNIFKDMVTPGSRQVRGYAVQICILLNNVSNLELGDSKEFPPLKILTTRTVHRYIAINDKIAVEDVEDVTDEYRLKKTPVKRAVSKKRPAAAVGEPVVKQKRTRVGKAAVAAKDSALVPVAQEAIPLQVVEPFTAVPPKPKRKAPKRKLKLTPGSDDETVTKDAMWRIMRNKEKRKWLMLLCKKQLWKLLLRKWERPDELLSIEEHLAQIPDNAFLPSIVAADITQIRFGQGIEMREVDTYKASLPKIAETDKVIGDIFQRRAGPKNWAETDSVLIELQRRVYIIDKYRELLLRKFIEVRQQNFVSGTPTTAIDLKVLDLLTVVHHFALKFLLRQIREHKLEWTRPSSSSLCEGGALDRGFFIPSNHRTIFSKCWISPQAAKTPSMPRYTPARKLCDLQYYEHV
ncbi:hypothetical protein F511_41196 [Dorcoceras hygrometricum]|uniref:Uncharacterized protein n=1 Tax=Dorcoceras hygrometricum TaxID=472368 RepID=A0A2Z6ZZS8_9LAMI|nr:hypothetical protein F511_41196 [Dorcoceras hygrometricum]